MDWHFDNLSGSYIQSQVDCVLSEDGIYVWYLTWLVENGHWSVSSRLLLVKFSLVHIQAYCQFGLLFVCSVHVVD